MNENILGVGVIIGENASPVGILVCKTQQSEDPVTGVGCFIRSQPRPEIAQREAAGLATMVDRRPKVAKCG